MFLILLGHWTVPVSEPPIPGVELGVSPPLSLPASAWGCVLAEPELGADAEDVEDPLFRLEPLVEAAPLSPLLGCSPPPALELSPYEAEEPALAFSEPVPGLEYP